MPTRADPAEVPVTPLLQMRRYDMAFQRFVSEAIHALMRAKNGVLAMMPVEQVANVPITRLTMTDGRVVDQPPIAVTAEFEVPVDDIIEGRFDSTYLSIDNAAEQALATLMPEFFKKISAISDAAGQTVDAAGRPPSHDLLLDLLEKVEVDFDDDGNPTMPTLVVNPATAKALRELPAPTPAQEARRAAIMKAHHDSYLARQRHRRLS